MIKKIKVFVLSVIRYCYYNNLNKTFCSELLIMFFLSPVGPAGERKMAGYSMMLSPSSSRMAGEGPEGTY